MSKYQFSIPDNTGHSVLEFDKAVPTDILAAKAMFDKLVGEHYRVAQRRSGETDYKVSKTFDPTQDEALVVRPMQGG
jgi:hypothetical protein